MVKSDIFSDKKKKTRNDLYQSTAREMAASKSKIVRLNVGGVRINALCLFATDY